MLKEIKLKCDIHHACFVKFNWQKITSTDMISM